MTAFREKWMPLAEHRPSGLPVTLVACGEWRSGTPRWRASLADATMWDFPMVPERPVMRDKHGRYWVSRSEWVTPAPAVRDKYGAVDPANALHWYAGG